MLKKRHSAVTASAITLLPRASCLQDGTEESPADSGRNAIIVEPPFFDGGEGACFCCRAASPVTESGFVAWMTCFNTCSVRPTFLFVQAFFKPTNQASESKHDARDKCRRDDAGAQPRRIPRSSGTLCIAGLNIR